MLRNTQEYSKIILLVLALACDIRPQVKCFFIYLKSYTQIVCLSNHKPLIHDGDSSDLCLHASQDNSIRARLPKPARRRITTSQGLHAIAYCLASREIIFLMVALVIRYKRKEDKKKLLPSQPSFAANPRFL